MIKGILLNLSMVCNLQHSIDGDTPIERSYILRLRTQDVPKVREQNDMKYWYKMNPKKISNLEYLLGAHFITTLCIILRASRRFNLNL